MASKAHSTPWASLNFPKWERHGFLEIIQSGGSDTSSLAVQSFLQRKSHPTTPVRKAGTGSAVGGSPEPCLLAPSPGDPEILPKSHWTPGNPLHLAYGGNGSQGNKANHPHATWVVCGRAGPTSRSTGPKAPTLSPELPKYSHLNISTYIKH